MELTNIKKLITKNKVYISLEKVINKYSSEENIYIFATVLYIYYFAKYKPQYIINFVKTPLVIVAILAYILYIFNSNIKIAIILTIALILTITTEEEEVFLKGIHSSSITRPIVNRERFANPEDSDDDEIEDANNGDGVDGELQAHGDGDGDGDGDDGGDDNDGASDEGGDGFGDGDGNNDSDDDGGDGFGDGDGNDSDNEEAGDEDDSDGGVDGDDYKNYTSNNFSKYGIIPKNSMNDTFKDLHLAIHNLENFMNSSK